MAPRNNDKSVPTNKRGSNNDQQSSASKKPKPSPPPKVEIVSSITPNKSPRDPNEYRVIRLSTGLTVALISRKEPPGVDGTRSSSTFLHGKSLAVWPLPNASKPECTLKPEPVRAFPLRCSTTTTTSPLEPRSTGGPSTTMHRATPNDISYTSVAVVVNVGSLNDSPDCEGLAHFTEHMVHYGSKKFPNEDAVSVVVANFGTYNATTRQHTTSYYNEVPDLVLENSLAMFAEMLTEPLFKLEVLNREVNAVDNEFYLGLPYWRRFLLTSHVCIEGTAHPLKRFTCGSLDTLGKGKEGEKVQREMKDYHQKNYVASAMTLSINSTKSLDELQELTLRHFSDFLQGDRSTYVKSPEETENPPLKFKGNQHVFLQGLSNRAELTMVWYLSAFADQDRVMPFIVHLLSDSSVKSLDHYLRSQELIWSMSPMQGGTRYATILEIDFFLTEKGSQNVYQIVEATFNFIRILQNASEPEMKRAFDEIRVQNLKAYHYGNQKSTLETTKDFAMRLQYIDQVSNVVSSESWMDSQLNFPAVQQALALIENEKTITLIETLSKKDGDKLRDKGEIQTAPHSNAKFVVKPWRKDLLSSTTCSSSASSTTNGSGDNAGNLGFIPENRYLRIDLKTMANSAGPGYALRCPENCGDIDPQQLTWSSSNDSGHSDSIPKILGTHQGHKTFGNHPFYSAIQLQFISSVDRIFTRRNYALSWLWGCVLIQKVSPYWSELIHAGFDVEIHPGFPLTLFVGGFPRHLDQAINAMISCVFEMPATHTVFSLAKQQLCAIWEANLNNSDLVSNTLLNCTMVENSDLSIDFLGTLQELTPHDLNIYIKAFRQSAFASLTLIGNIPVKAFSVVASHLETMPFAPKVDNNWSLYETDFFAVKPDFYCPGESCIRVKILNSSVYTTSVTNVYVLGPYGTDVSQADLFSAAIFFMNCQAFMNLRTQKQLGYAVHVKKYIHQAVRVPLMMFSITIIATARKFTACELDQKIDQFLAEYAEYVRSMSPAVFKTMLELTGTSEEVAQDTVANWFQSKFNQHFGRVDIKRKCLSARIKKVSIQILSENEEAQPKICNCQICSSIDWKSGYSIQSGSHFNFAVGKGATKKYFVSSFN